MSSSPRLFALLIGIDRYRSVQDPDAPRYPSLRGAVADVRRVAHYLRHGLGVAGDRIIQVTAPAGVAARAHSDGWPSYERMIAAFLAVGRGARAGDQVLVHFAGHGGRVPTALPEIKGADGLDECLVPFDIGDPGARYLRDVELAYWLEAMRTRSVFVTLILDCCFAGGATRGNHCNRRIRGGDRSDRRRLPATSDLASWPRIAAAWPGVRTASAGPGRRQLALGAGQGLRPRGHALLAACRPDQRAYEDVVDDGGPGGALTHAFLQALGTIGQGGSYAELYRAVLAGVRCRFPEQTPVFEGEGDRLVLGRRRLPPRVGVAVLQSGRSTVRLATGRVHGVGRGARFTIRSMACTGSDDSAIKARVEVVRVSACACLASVEAAAGRPIIAGDRAELIRLAHASQRRGVRVRLADGMGRESDTLKACTRALAEQGGGWLEAEAHGPVDFEIAFAADGGIAIRDGAGREVPYLGRPLSLEDPRWPAEMVSRLVHLARFVACETLPGATDGVIVGLAPLPGGYHPRMPLRLPADREVGPAGVRAGAWVVLTIRSRLRVGLHITVLDARPDWAVTQVFPPADGAPFHSLEADARLLVPLRATLPAAMPSGVDRLIVLATTRPLDHRWLQLPPLYRGPRPAAAAAGGHQRAAFERPWSAVTTAPARAAAAADAGGDTAFVVRRRLRIEATDADSDDRLRFF